MNFDLSFIHSDRSSPETRQFSRSTPSAAAVTTATFTPPPPTTFTAATTAAGRLRQEGLHDGLAHTCERATDQSGGSAFAAGLGGKK